MAKNKVDPQPGTDPTPGAPPEPVAAPSHGQLREWHEERRKEFSNAQAEYDAAEKAGTVDAPELLSKQQAHLSRIAELDKLLDDGLRRVEFGRLEAAGEDLARRFAAVGQAINDDGGPGSGPGLGGPTPEELTRPEWYEEVTHGRWDGPALQKWSQSEDYHTLAQQTSDGPAGGFQVPTLHVRGLHRAYPAYRLEGVCRNIYVMDYSDFHLDAVTGFAMDPAVYLAPGQEAPKRDYRTDRRLLSPWRQTAQNIMDRPMNRLADYAMQVEEEMGLQFLRGTEACLVRGPTANVEHGGSANLGPAGVFTTDEGGLPASRDVAGNNTATVVEDEAWIDARQSLKSESRMSMGLRWVFHRTTMGRVMNLKGSDGHRLFREALRVGEPDMLVGIPIVESEEAPADFTASKRIAVLGDWTKYVIVHWLNGAVMAFDASQHYATKGQTGTVYERYNSGAVMTSDAFAAVKMGA